MTNTPTSDSAREEWDARYADEDRLWSGHVNGPLPIEIGHLEPGSALDVGCGEGADAIWLAEQGWTVTAIDVSGVAVDRARAEAERRSLTIAWIAGDFPADLGSETFDLVALHYPAFPIASLDAVANGLLSAVAPGGTLLLVGHAPPEDPDAYEWRHDDFVQPPDIAARMGDDWTIEVDETRPRPDTHHHSGHHVNDVVLKARRG